MASFLKANLPSDDETDADYAPKLKQTETPPPTTAREGATRGKASIDPAQASSIDALWKTLQSRTTKKRADQKPATPAVQWNATFAAPRPVTKPERRSQTDEALTAERSAAPTDTAVAEVRIGSRDGAEREVDAKGADKSEGKALGKRSRIRGVDALLASFEKKKKATVLDHSKEGWRAFKQAHSTDAEELSAHHKSAEPYLEKQEFLSKTAQREREAEIDRKQKRTT